MPGTRSRFLRWGLPPRAMIDLSRQPAGMRVEYETSQRENKEMSPLQGKSPGMAQIKMTGVVLLPFRG